MHENGIGSCFSSFCQRQQSDPNLRGIKAGNRNDVTQRNWLGRCAHAAGFLFVVKYFLRPLKYFIAPFSSFFPPTSFSSSSSFFFTSPPPSSLRFLLFSLLSLPSFLSPPSLSSSSFLLSFLLPFYLSPTSVELTNTQIALQGIEHHGFVLASSSIAQVFGCDHEPRLREGDLVTKKSLICKVLDMQVAVHACTYLCVHVFT